MSNRTSGRNFSEFDNMSTEALEEILRLDSQLPEGEDCDTDLIIYITEVIAKREQEKPTGKLPDIDKAWDVFNEKYRPYPSDGHSLYEDEYSNITEFSSIRTKPSTPVNSSPVRRRGLGFARAVCVVAVIAVLALAGTATAYAMGYDIWGYVAEWSRETFGFVSENQTLPSNLPSQSVQNELSDLQAALNEHGISEKLVPKYIPEGYDETEFYIDSNNDSILLAAIFSKSGQSIVIDIMTNADIFHSNYQKDEDNPERYEVDGIEHHIMTNKDEYLAVWRNGNYEGSISGLETKEELIKMIDSIYEEK